MDPFSASFLGLGFLGAMLQAGTGLGTGLYGAQVSEASNKRNLEESARQFDTNLEWQREQFAKMVEMSNTQHQREVADLRAAGLNPILSANSGGAYVPSAVGSPAPTAHASDLDLSGSLKMISDSVNSASETALKSQDIQSMMALREAQGAEALSEAAKNDKLGPAMEKDLLAKAQASAASANYHNALATQSHFLTPLQGELLRTQVAKEMANALGIRINNQYLHRHNMKRLMSEDAKADYLRGRLQVERVNAARKVFETGRDTILPKRFLRLNGDSNSSSSDFGLGELIFPRN